MSRATKLLCITLLIAGFTFLTFAQQSTDKSVIPTLVNFSGKLADVNGRALVGTVGVTFFLYKDSQDSTPLWIESQNVQADKYGNYTVMLGSTKAQGLPTDLFISGEARWLGVRPENQPEQPRILLLSVPYALKAGDAQTIGGLPPSAFVLAVPTTTSSTSVGSANVSAPSPPPSGAVTGTGTVNFIPLWDSTSDIISSVIFQSGTGATAKIGINNTAPSSTLDVKGTGTIRGVLSLPSTGTATSSAGFNSQPLNLAGSVFNSGTGTAVAQNFRLLAEPAGNDTTSASGTLNLQFASGTNSFSETGLKVASNGQITFASGQTFPGAGSGTVTSVGSGSGLTGGPITSSGALSIATAGVTNAMLQNSSLTITPGTGLTGGGTVGLGSNTTLNLDTTKVVTAVTAGTDLTGGGTGGALTLNLDTTKVPQLATSNTFTGNQNITGNVVATGSVAGTTANFTGTVTASGAFLPNSGAATASQGFNSQPLDLAASAFNSNSATALEEDFRWLAEPVGNDTSSPSAKLNLLFGANGGIPAETGLSVASNGVITFASTQTFPNGGTVTSVGSGSGLTGGPITSSGALSIATAGVTNAMLQNSSLTVSPGTDLTGGGTISLGGTAILNLDTSKVPQLNAPNTFTGNQNITGNITATGNIGGALGSFGGSSTNAVLGVSNSGTGDGITSVASGLHGVFGQSLSTTDFSAGVAGTSFAGSGKTTGVTGTNFSNGGGAGVYGLENGQSTTGAGFTGGAGVWGDGGNNGKNGILATADNAHAVVAVNNSTSLASLTVQNNTSTQGAPAFQAFGDFGTCTITVTGNITCTGSITGVVPVDGGSHKVGLYALQAPDNWFEDASSGQLSSGSAAITLEPIFAQTVNANIEYHVFLTPKGDCDGLYVSNETPAGFEVHELHGGHSNVAFDYRIMARRKGYESIRLADMTASMPSSHFATQKP